jgi:hypothetical protein
VPKKQSKRQLILALWRERSLERAGEREIRALQRELRERLGAEEATALSYIASVLREAGTRVDYQDRFVDPSLDEPYASRINGTLRFRDLASAEQSLQKLDALYREYREASDRVGTSLVRAVVLRGKQRAESVGANPRVRPEKRQEKQEIARWFHVWLETSDLFFDWLEIRKQSEEFRRLLSNPREEGKAP